MVIKMKIGFIGLGNMANAMIGGILAKGLYTKEELLTVYEANKTLFQDVVNVIIHNENFCNDRDSEYDDSFLSYPETNKNKLKLFNEEERTVINDFYAFQQYILNYH